MRVIGWTIFWFGVLGLIIWAGFWLDARDEADAPRRAKIRLEHNMKYKEWCDSVGGKVEWNRYKDYVKCH